MRKIGIITATRAEYGLLLPLIRKLREDAAFVCHVIVTGTHLLEKYGNTIDVIHADGISIQHTVPIMDGEADPCQVIAKAILCFDKIYREEKYDGIVLLGDRYELYGFAIPALLQNIPIIHIHGGEKTEGAIDEKIRHSVTKMASIHFPSIKEYADRIIQMGEDPDFVFPVGALGIDNIMRLIPVPREELGRDLGLDLGKPTALVTYHPVTTYDLEDMKEQVHTVMESLAETSLQAVVTMPNSDTGGNELYQIITDYVSRYSDRMVFVRNLGQKRYLSCMRYAALVYGNSSSGIIETASFGVPTINIGDRQEGRFAPANVIHCRCERQAIREALKKGLSVQFRETLRYCFNPYGDGHAAEKMAGILKEIDWSDPRLVRKSFHDIPGPGGRL